MNFVELVFGSYLKSSRWLSSLNQPQNGTVKDFEHVLREIEFHNSGSAGWWRVYDV